MAHHGNRPKLDIAFKYGYAQYWSIIAWGIDCPLIADGYLPKQNKEHVAGPMLTYLLPILIGYTGGYDPQLNVCCRSHCAKITGSSVPVFIGAMVMGPLGGWTIKKFDEKFSEKFVRIWMLANNFSWSRWFCIIALAFYAIGPVVSTYWSYWIKEAIVNARLPQANIIITTG